MTRKTLAKRLGQELKKARKHKSEWTQGRLAEKVKCSQATIAQIEAGRKLPGLEMLHKIEDALGAYVWGNW